MCTQRRDHCQHTLKDLVGRTYTFKLKLFEFKFSSCKHQSLTTARTFDDNERQPLPNFAEHFSFLNCLCTERNPGTGAVNTKASNGATREAPKTNGGMTLLMVEGTSAATPTLPTHMELMLR
ncbi:hypothetical protein Bca52824_046841 [Brassica carinata]|uniref:Uncharacterized protein n=1 Tax=Brassica carinata TaxID=52824 RepID=A0A8X7UQL3_BRACI|nr:hypothetical protein Bca52824_046841 [Brassica carinata]